MKARAVAGSLRQSVACCPAPLPLSAQVMKRPPARVAVDAVLFAREALKIGTPSQFTLLVRERITLIGTRSPWVVAPLGHRHCSGPENGRQPVSIRPRARPRQRLDSTRYADQGGAPGRQDRRELRKHARARCRLTEHLQAVREHSRIPAALAVFDVVVDRVIVA